jgi:hypothetical protein
MRPTDGFLFPNAKGGDLHHHFSGSIYAEPILEDAIAEDFTSIPLLRSARKTCSRKLGEILCNK